MSRIGRKPINIPAGVDVKVENGVVTVKGPKKSKAQRSKSPVPMTRKRTARSTA